MKQYVQDRFIALGGLGCVAYGISLCNEYVEESAFFPLMCLYAIGFLLVLLGIDSILTERRLKAKQKQAVQAPAMNWGPFTVVSAFLILYAASVVFLGFYLASVLFLLAVGFIWKGVKPWVIIVFLICFMIFLYVCFTLLFNVPLPKPMFF